MAKPRIFVSSTYYDLKHIRNSLESFIEQLGFEPVLFESGDIPFHPDSPLDESCYAEVRNCHILVLIIGGRYGTAASEGQPKPDAKLQQDVYQRFNSITKREYETARERDIPIYTFVEKNVLAEYQTYKSNRDNTSIQWAHVDSTNIFNLLDDVYAQRKNNPVKEFEKSADITSYLRDQWAGLFSDFLSRRTTDAALRDLSAQVDGLSQISDVLKKYTESIMRRVEPDDSEKLIREQDKRLGFLQVLQHPFIKDFVPHLRRRHGVDLKENRVISLVTSSPSYDEFLTKLQLTEEAAKQLSTSDRARSEYNDFRNRYLRYIRKLSEKDSTGDGDIQPRRQNETLQSRRKVKNSHARQKSAD